MVILSIGSVHRFCTPPKKMRTNSSWHLSPYLRTNPLIPVGRADYWMMIGRAWWISFCSFKVNCCGLYHGFPHHGNNMKPPPNLEEYFFWKTFFPSRIFIIFKCFCKYTNPMGWTQGAWLCFVARFLIRLKPMDSGPLDAMSGGTQFPSGKGNGS